MSVMAQNAAGDTVPAYARYIAVPATRVISNEWRPPSQTTAQATVDRIAFAGYERILEVLDARNDVPDFPDAKRAPRLRGAIEFRNVDFEYEPEQRVLEHFNFKIEAGQIAAFVGPTGAGKSSIAGLIARFYDPVAGQVLVDGVDVRRFTQKSLRDQISFVLQETVLFHGTIWENIAYGKPHSSKREIEHAARMANAEEFIAKMPEGYDTIVGERGVTLSGGQRQRIAIARAIIRDSPILILDEPTSGLDAVSEKLVIEALESLMRDRTTIMIAHRLSTIRNAHVISVIQDGKVVEQGSHQDLLSRNSVYAELIRAQFETA
jgi:subfamily B ATP-binding cassette protein MsbA